MATPGFDELALLKSMPADIIVQTKQEIPGADGYVGGNSAANFRADNQRTAMFTLVVGIVNGIDAYVDAGWRAIDVTYQHQTAAGDFGQEGANACHFFVAWSNHAMNLLRKSPYAAGYKDRLDALLPKIQLATDYLVAHRADLSGDFGSPNRTMITANAFAFGYLLLKGFSPQAKLDSYYDEMTWWMNNEFVDNAYSHTKLNRELDGVFLEAGGYDTGYDATGLYMLLHIVCYFPAEPFLPDAIARGGKAARFLVKRVLPDGTIDGTFNTRSGPGNESGDAKNTNLTELRLALIYYAMMYGNQEALAELASIKNAVPTTTVNGLPPVIFSPSTAEAQVGKPFTYTILATNSPPAALDKTSPPSVISVSGQPGWLHLDSTGGFARSTAYRTLSGTPTQAGSYAFTVASNNPSGIAQGTGTATITITVAPP